MTRWVIGLAVASAIATGCATFNGNVDRWYQVAQWERQPLAGRVWFETPVVVDNDEDHDFTPYIGPYASSIQTIMVKDACEYGAFQTCLPQRPRDDGAYKVSTKVEINNFRSDHALGAGMLFGLLAPPLFGMIWAIPWQGGNIDMVVHWTLHHPSGDVLAEGQGTYEGVVEGIRGRKNSSAFDSKARERNCLPGFPDFLATASTIIADMAQNSTAVASEPGPTPIEPRAHVLALPPSVGTHSDGSSPHMGPRPPVPSAQGPIVAVFLIEDASKRLPVATLDQLTEYLAVKLTHIAGYRVVPRDQVRERLAQEQAESYKECYDQSCQIELGRAVAAEKSLSTKLIQIGNQCAITSVLYDLVTETTERAASADTACSDEALMLGMKQIAEQLSVK